MIQFIHIKDDEGSGIVINIDSIDAFYYLEHGGVTLIYVRDHDKFTVNGNRVQEIP